MAKGAWKLEWTKIIVIREKTGHVATSAIAASRRATIISVAISVTEMGSLKPLSVFEEECGDRRRKAATVR